MRKLLSFIGWAALVVGLLAIPAAYAIDAMFGKNVVWMARVNSQAEREYLEKNHDERDPVILIYGEPSEWKDDARRDPEFTRTIFFSGTGDVFTSARDPELAMLLATDGTAPLQASSVHHISWLVAGGALGFAVVLLTVLRLTRPKDDAPASEGESSGE